MENTLENILEIMKTNTLKYLKKSHDENDHNFSKEFNIIVTGYSNGQIRFDMKYNPKDMEDFIVNIFERLDLRYVSDIVKISCSSPHMRDIKWYEERNGKFYFNPNVNDDDDTRYLDMCRKYFIYIKLSREKKQ